MEETPPAANVTLEQVTGLRQHLSDLFMIEEMQLNTPQRGVVQFLGRMMCDPATCFETLKERFEEHGYTPMLREAKGNQQVLLAMPFVIEPTESNVWINLVLFIATVLSTMFAGAASDPAFTGTELWLGLPFSLSIMLILGAHELGHFFAGRYHKVDVSLPYFIPLPISIIGTLGAFIRMRAPTLNRRALLDVGAAGPIAGMVFALPILIYGLMTSEMTNLPEGGYLLEGNSLLYSSLKYLIFGQMLPSGGVDVTLNQMAWAGWVGLLVTGLNLLPVGQLDGGHITFTLIGDAARLLYWPAIAALIGIGLLTGNALQWGIWAALLLLMRNRHAQPLDNVTRLDPARKMIAVICLLLFILVFVPIPLTIVP